MSQMSVHMLLGCFQRFDRPFGGIQNPPAFLHRFPILIHQAFGICSQLGRLREGQGPRELVGVVLHSERTGVPKFMEVVSSGAIEQGDFDEVSPCVALGVGLVIECHSVKGLVDISHQVHQVSCEEGPFCGVLVDVAAQDMVSLVHHVDRIEHCLGEVDLRKYPIGDVGIVDEMPGVPQVHVVLRVFDVVGPAGRLDEGSGLLIYQMVDRLHQFLEMNGSVRVEFLEPGIGNGCSQHMSDVPPAYSQQRQQQGYNI